MLGSREALSSPSKYAQNTEPKPHPIRGLFLPQTLVRLSESKRKSPLAKSKARIADLAALVEELLIDDEMSLAIAGALGAAEKLVDSTPGSAG